MYASWCDVRIVVWCTHRGQMYAVWCDVRIVVWCTHRGLMYASWCDVRIVVWCTHRGVMYESRSDVRTVRIVVWSYALWCETSVSRRDVRWCVISTINVTKLMYVWWSYSLDLTALCSPTWSFFITDDNSNVLLLSHGGRLFSLINHIQWYLIYLSSFFYAFQRLRGVMFLFVTELVCHRTANHYTKSYFGKLSGSEIRHQTRENKVRIPIKSRIRIPISIRHYIVFGEIGIFSTFISEPEFGDRGHSRYRIEFGTFAG